MFNILPSNNNSCTSCSMSLTHLILNIRFWFLCLEENNQFWSNRKEVINPSLLYICQDRIETRWKTLDEIGNHFLLRQQRDWVGGLRKIAILAEVQYYLCWIYVKLNRSGLNWIKFVHIGYDWIKLVHIWYDWIKSDQNGLNWIELDQWRHNFWYRKSQ